MAQTTIYKTNGDILVRQWTKGERPGLKWLQTAVGGYIELVPGPWQEDQVEVYANEEGLLQGLPLNTEAAKALGFVVAALEGVLRGDVVRLDGFPQDEDEIPGVNPTKADGGEMDLGECYGPII